MKNKELVVKLLPEIKEIGSVELQEKVIACWTEAIEFRGWTKAYCRI